MEAMNAAVLQMSNSLPPEEGTSSLSLKESAKEPGNSERTAPVPTGLSALLSAVTLQLNDTNEQESRSNVSKSLNTVRVVSSDADSEQKVGNHNDTDTQKSTPTMAPEESKQMPLLESLMTLLLDDNNANILTFLPDGKFFAIRTREFTTHFAKQYFSVDTFESFQEELRGAGFVHVETDQLSGIEVFRHRLFNKGDWKGCELLVAELELQRGAESMSPAKIDSPTNKSLDDYCVNRSDTTFKRRLSPAHAQRVDGESQSLSQKAKVQNGSTSHGSEGVDNLNMPIPQDPVRLLREVSDDDHQGAARSIAVEKILCNGQGSPLMVQQSLPLEQQAVADTTRAIVTDAIESLLRDEDHTRETFRKHERTLSQSSLPGVVPISKQLFDSKQTSSSKGKGGKHNGESSEAGHNKSNQGNKGD